MLFLRKLQFSKGRFTKIRNALPLIWLTKKRLPVEIAGNDLNEDSRFVKIRNWRYVVNEGMGSHHEYFEHRSHIR